MKFKTFRMIFSIFCLAILFIIPANASAAEEITQIRFGLIPSEDADKLIADSQPFIKELEKNIGLPIKPYVAIDYSAVIEALKSNQLEIAFLGPASYVLAKDKVGCPIDAVARGVMAQTGKSSYQMYLITQPKSNIYDMQDLKGRTFAFVDPASTSGNFMPRYVFSRNHIDPEKDFKSIYYSGTHQASLIAVKEGKVDAGCIASEVYDLAIERGQMKESDVRVFYRSQPIPGSPFVVRTNLPQELQDKLRKGFLDLKGVRFGKLGVVNEMDPATDADYDIVRTLVALKEKAKAAKKD
ncbi:MAG: phosphate/phosphite/phosphonate ABC transporter substrate-binding protein [Desulfobacterales bacterium]|nr:MAG: phosphate/phosphite/phosphonate ABC transporter substrate-binding protein [Desulfobacterales bacterium]